MSICTWVSCKNLLTCFYTFGFDCLATAVLFFV
uniref:Uncharacterized protein n=1 Tax=Arundo donax TaxID=35708 RepID=A0A0A9ETK6_ARUDO